MLFIRFSLNYSAPPAPQPPPIPPGLINVNIAAHMQQQFHAGQQIEKHYVQQAVYMPQGPPAVPNQVT